MSHHFLVILACLLLWSKGIAAETPLTGHGTLNGEPFWLRWLPPESSTSSLRVLQVVWTPPSLDSVGANYGDVPFLLLDPMARIVAFDGRSTLGRIMPGPRGADVTREIMSGTGAQAVPAEAKRRVPGERAWDLQLAPLLCALVWRPTSTGSVRVVDYFGPRFREPLRASWLDNQVVLAGATLAATAGPQGRLATLTGPGCVLIIQNWSHAP